MMNIAYFRTKVIPHVEAEVRQARDTALQHLDEEVKALTEFINENIEESDDINDLECKLDKILKQVGLATLEAFMATRRVAPSKLKAKDADHRTYCYRGEATLPLRSSFGEGHYRDSVYHRGAKTKVGEHRRLSLLGHCVGLLAFGGLTLHLAMMAGEFITRMPYAPGKALLEHFFPYVPSTRSLRGLIRFLAQHAAPVLDDLECKSEGATIVVIQIDARGLPVIKDSEYRKRCRPHRKRSAEERLKGRRRKRHMSKPRRKKGDKAKTTKRVHVGVIYTMARLEDGTIVGPLGKKIIARMDGAEGVFSRLAADANKMPSSVEERLFISDGDPHYARLRGKYFADWIAVVDFYHVAEYLWKAAGTLYREGSAELIAFVKRLKGMILDGKVVEVVDLLKERARELHKGGPASKDKDKDKERQR